MPVPTLCRRFAVAIVATAIGCGGPSFDGRTYQGEKFAFRVPEPPPRWSRLEMSDAALAFRDEERDATVVINGRCGRDGEDIPLQSLTQHLFLMFTDREIQSQEVIPFDGREALHTVMTAKLDGVEKRFSVYVLKKDGCVYDFIYIARPDRYEAGVGDFDQYVRGFTALPRSST